MAVTYAPFDAGAGSAITEATWQMFARRFLQSGVIRGYLNQLAVTADGTTLGGSVASGGAFAEGFYYQSDAAIAFTVGTANATNPRIDRVVLRLDRTANTITQTVLAGTAAASPTPPALTQTDILWDVPLAQVRVDAAVGVIAANKITDERFLTANGQKPRQGLAANRPAAGTQGQSYYSTDTDAFSVDDGTAWHDFISVASANAAYPSLAGGSVITASGAGVKGLVSKTAASPTANAIEVQNNGGTPLFAIRPDGRLYFSNGTGQTSSTVGAAGTAAALPSLPAGYLSIEITVGNFVKIPYYLP